MEIGREEPLCPICAEVDNPDLRYRRNFDGIVHVNCCCCGYDYCQELPKYRASDDFAGGFCTGCREPYEIEMREHNAERYARLQTTEAELARRKKDPAVIAYLATAARRQEIEGEFERMPCNDSYG